jgi:hypothetical protein
MDTSCAAAVTGEWGASLPISLMFAGFLLDHFLSFCLVFAPLAGRLGKLLVALLDLLLDI